MKIKPIKHAHKVCALVYHFVTTPKRRGKVLTEEITVNLFKEAVKDFPIYILEGEVMPEHIHMMIQSDVNHSPSDIMNIIKTKSSRLIKERLPDWKGWSRGGYISTVGKDSIEGVVKYIQEQKEKD